MNFNTILSLIFLITSVVVNAQDVADYFKDDDSVECFNWIGESGIHRSKDIETKKKYEKLIRTKMDIMNVSFDRHGYGLILDTDMIIVNAFSNKFFNLLTEDIPHDGKKKSNCCI